MAMQNKYNQFFNFFLFSGLACFSYLSLVLYTDLTPQHQKILISFLGFISVVFIFNLVGFSLIFINRWLKKSYLFFIKKRNKLIINCILIAAILFFMNYATLTICKVLLERPFPFVLSSPGLRLIMIIWLVEIVIVSLSIMNAFYRQLVILHEKTMKLEESSIKAQYTALQNQLNPHFLFNSLNTLISEIEYNPENAVEELNTAIEELAEDGITIDESNPIQIEYPYPSAVEVYTNKANSYKKSVEAALGGKVVINLVDAVDLDGWYYAGYYVNYGYEQNYDVYDVSGWSPDFGDPCSYLDTMLPDYEGYMTKCFGIF